jgi:4-oxalocrotonate tautomerase
MPFVRISLKTTRAEVERRAIADAVHRGLQSSIGIPEQDRFQIIETCGGDLIVDPDFLGVSRDEGAIFVEIHLSVGRSLDKKRALYRDVADELEAVGVERRNVFIHLVETTLENWSFGDGVAQYAEHPPAHV